MSDSTMNNVNVDKDIRSLVAEILEMDPKGIDGEAHFVKDLGMDSMMALEILAGVEKKYRISIPEDLLPQFTNLNKTIEIVMNLLKNK